VSVSKDLRVSARLSEDRQESLRIGKNRYDSDTTRHSSVQHKHASVRPLTVVCTLPGAFGTHCNSRAMLIHATYILYVSAWVHSCSAPARGITMPSITNACCAFQYTYALRSSMSVPSTGSMGCHFLNSFSLPLLEYRTR
jgi:hypothetical protein